MYIRQEVRKLASQFLDGTPMYPGDWLLTWVKAPFMPEVLVGMEPMPKANANVNAQR